MREKIFAFLILLLLAFVVLGTLYSVVDSLFTKCNGGKTRVIEYYDPSAPGVVLDTVCTNGSHWVWQKDPLKQVK